MRERERERERRKSERRRERRKDLVGVHASIGTGGAGGGVVVMRMCVMKLVDGVPVVSRVPEGESRFVACRCVT